MNDEITNRELLKHREYLPRELGKVALLHIGILKIQDFLGLIVSCFICKINIIKSLLNLPRGLVDL